MTYIGKEPADSFISFAKQDFSTSATTSYTLDNAVTNENELALFINFVRQEPTTAYTASGTTLTLTSATTSSDDMYCVYLGQAKQTVNAPDGSVGSSQVASTIITGQTAETSIATDDLILLSDTSASGALKKMTRANFVSGVGGANTPTFLAYLSSNQTISASTEVKVQFNTEVYDTASAYDNSSNYRFTPQTAGKYIVYAVVDHSWTGDWGDQRFLRIKKNGSNIGRNDQFVKTTSASNYGTVQLTASCSMNGSSDYLEAFVYSNATSPVINGNLDRTYFGAYKIIE